ncbi:LOW QUALITY PROTEIN: RING finger protein 112-like [Trachemys scripta elegans]|uniref:LOW QUALITY PROTEIN: RING finger protein 112-like n=1 Tax=Trachemys scripta elegans TaxID=31138 RepID=UPI001555186C|nr:LOW QUALITY PROTEIN: RING finger protein 112-like [Trachemys scripta elegans]
MEQLREDVTCSICLDVLNDPVSIECGHNFCRGCLSIHWSKVSAQGRRCPECRAPCSGGRMIPDTRVKSLVEKFTELLREEPEPQGPGAPPEMGRPVQLVRLDEEGGLTLDKEALSHCLERGGGRPRCLVSIIGEQRLGKSFLLNYLLRRLRSPDVRDGSWMGREDELLEGFEWRADMQPVTHGVWAWSQPFWVPTEGGKVAVLLVDTEGSMDLKSNKETSIKLSAMSMLLSSYQILNVGRRLKDPDLEYLEMFVQVAEVVGGGLRTGAHSASRPAGARFEYPQGPRSPGWGAASEIHQTAGFVLPPAVSENEAKEIHIMLMETSPCKHPKTLEALSRSSSCCYLMPSPGERIVSGSEGRLRDMGENFRESLRDYITTLVSSAGQHIRTDRHGKLLTGTQLAAKIKNLSDVMKKHRSGFSSPCQMAITFHNQRVLDRAHADHAFFLKEKDGLSQRVVDCLKVDPGAMVKQLVEQRRSLLGRCREEMKEPAETLLTALEEELTREAKTFLETYRRRYQCHATNKSEMDRACRDHTAFLKEKDTKNPIKCLKVWPGKMAKLLAEQREQLLERCRTHMLPKKEVLGMELEVELTQKKEALLMELEAELMREAETFLEIYRKRFTTSAIAAGAAAGTVVLAPVGGAAAAGIAAAVGVAEAVALGVAEAVAIGVGAGAVTGMCVGGGVGGGVGGNIARQDMNRAEATASQGEEGDGTEDLSDTAPLI